MTWLSSVSDQVMQKLMHTAIVAAMDDRANERMYMTDKKLGIAQEEESDDDGAGTSTAPGPVPNGTQGAGEDSNGADPNSADGNASDTNGGDHNGVGDEDI